MNIYLSFIIEPSNANNNNYIAHNFVLRVYTYIFDTNFMLAFLHVYKWFDIFHEPSLQKEARRSKLAA